MKHILLILLISLCSTSYSQNKYVFVFLHSNADAPKLTEAETSKIIEGHMANMGKLNKEGKLLAAGPFDNGGGLFIFKDAPIPEVQEWLSEDPGVKAKRWNIELLPYEPLIGGVCPVGEKYTMTNYTFIHFRPKVYKFNIQEASETVSQHNKFIKELATGGNVITYATFGGIDGGILVMKGDVDRDILQQDPAVAATLFNADIKQLYIALGSFCEK